MQQKRIAVLTVSYNHEKWIRQNIESVRIQQCSLPIAHYVWDDHSSDKTWDIIRDTNQVEASNYQLISFRQPQNRGAANNYWDALQAILQDERNIYIALLDGDDYFCDEQALEKKIKILDQDTEVGIVHSNTYILHSNGKLSKDYVRKKEDVPQGYILEIILHKAIFNALTVVLRADLMRDLPIDNELRQLPLQTIDHIVEVWACSKQKAAFIEDITGVWRRHNDTISTPQSLQSQLRWLEHECKQGRWLDQHFAAARFGEEEENYYRNVETFAAYFRCGEYDKAKSILVQHPYVKNEYPRMGSIISKGKLYYTLYRALKRLIKK